MTKTHRAIPVPALLDLVERLPEFRAALLQQRQFRLEQLQELADLTADSSPAGGDVHDQVNEILRASAMSALADVDDALDRLRAGTYGTCARCTQQIPSERLEILPMSRHCMRCQHAHETHST